MENSSKMLDFQKVLSSCVYVDTKQSWRVYNFLLIFFYDRGAIEIGVYICVVLHSC